MASSFMQLCMRIWNTNATLLSERFEPSPAAVIFTAGPLLTTRLIVLCVFYGFGTGWYWPYYALMLVNCIPVILINYGLRMPLADYLKWTPLRLFNLGGPIYFMMEVAPPMCGFFSPEFLRWTPFRNPMITMIYFFWLAIVCHVVEHILTPGQINQGRYHTRSAMKAASYQCTNAVRLVDPIADIILSTRLLLAAYAGACPYGREIRCGPHYGIGSVILMAGVVDFATSMVITRPWADSTEVALEAVMLSCEATIFVCSIFLLKFDMTVHDLMNGFQDMQAFTALCACGTFSALVITLSRLFVPVEMWDRLMQDPCRTLMCAAPRPTEELPQPVTVDVGKTTEQEETFDSFDEENSAVSQPRT